MRVIVAIVAAAAVLGLATGSARADETSFSRLASAKEETGLFAGDRGLAVKLGGGPGFVHIFSLTAIGADFEAAVGAQTAVGGWFGSLEFFGGETMAGLGTLRIQAGPSFEVPIGPLHLGVVGPRLGILTIRRATTDDSMQSLGIGGAALATIDVAKVDRFAFVLGARFGGDFYDDAFTWDGAASLGLRIERIGK